MYLRVKDRATLPPEQTVQVKDIAFLEGVDDNLTKKAMAAAIPCPKTMGVWKLEAFDVVKAILAVCPGEEINLLGPTVCYVHLAAPEKKDWLKPFRAVLAALLLVAGSALALAWFHSDVGMPDAQQEIYQLVAGKEAENPLFISIPYAVGVGLGVAFFYSLIGRKTISPMEIKLKQYRQDVEETEGREIPHD